ncbi:lytic murein transglycosylase B [Inhella sp. 4Y17]|uniref:Lytic murein transglycosylase B n=2 Tax=Inhella gelatinilytica TaxID=2795030 RepID=A0A931IU51_9BURK|nr:lytic murein transglycosylase B [Inhella gelatinilytica]
MAAPGKKKAPRKAPTLTAAAAPVHGSRTGHYEQRRDVRAWAHAQVAGPLNGWTEAEVLAQLGQARYQASVAQLILPPAVGQAKDWGAYRDRFIEPKRLQAGLAFWAQHEAALARAEQQTGVPASVVVGIIGVETFYGQILGRYRVLDALATLAFDFPVGRSNRSGFFRDELSEFLRLSRETGRDPAEFRGSFAGAMGWGQFMPSSWRTYAVDFDGDGQVDLRGSPVDAIGSVAHFLQKHGWQRGLVSHLAWAWPAEAPPDAHALARLLEPDIEPRWSADELQSAGISLPLPTPTPWALVKLDNGGAKPPTYVLGSPNFYVLTRYNRSAYYALAVATLGERIAQLRNAGQPERPSEGSGPVREDPRP